jgi:hypothetical protein
MALQLHQEGATFEIADTDLPGIDDPCDGVVYTIRVITTQKNREIAERFTKLVPNKKTHQMEEKVDGMGLTDALVDYAIGDWRGIKAGDADAPCTTENKMLLDGLRKAALVRAACINRSDDDKARSFRPTA